MSHVQDSRFLGGVNELTVITTIKRGRTQDGVLTYKQQLQKVLDSVVNRESKGIPTPIRLVQTIHFARWIIWEDPSSQEDKLIFTSNYDGSMWQYLRDFSTLIAADMDRVWGNCEGYPEQGCRDFDAFWQYVKQHQVKTTAFYAAIPDESLLRRQSLRSFKANFDRFMADWYADERRSCNAEFRQAFDRFVKENQTYLNIESTDPERPSELGKKSSSA
ncbi:MAG: hypothetical protein VYA55_06365 [Pseudomonadota bacterium]|nr:hypothetical protein [Pseudomonadota bacterium]